MKTPIHMLWFVWLIAVAPPVLAQSPTTVPAHQVYVNGTDGNDANSGNSADQPLKTFAKAVTLLKPGSVLVIARTAQPYREPLILRRGGEANAPIIVEGNGATIDLGEDVTEGPWKKDGDRYVLDRDTTNPGDLSQTAGAFIDGIPLGGVRGGQWKPGTMAYENGRIVLMPPAGKTPGTSRVILPRITASAVNLSAAHVIIRDLTAMHAGNDGFNLYGKVEGVRLQQVRALCNGDEGISAHQSAQVEVEDAEIAFNGSKAGGVADVDETVTTYRRCIVHHNRGSGFYFTTRKSQVIDCVGFDNGGAGLLAPNRKGEVIVENSVDLSNAAALAKADPRIKPVVERAMQIRRQLAQEGVTLFFAPLVPLPAECPNLPIVDLSADTARQVIIAEGKEKEGYQGHPTTLLLPDGKTMFCVWTQGHGGPCGPLKRSDDGGQTWSELLPVPENWKTTRNCPALYRLTDPQGMARLFVFAGRGPDGLMQQSVSIDEGRTWSPMRSVGLKCVMPFTTIVPVESGRKLIGLTNIRRPGETKDPRSTVIAQSESTDGGLTWSPWRVIVDLGELKPCEPEVVRSPDGRQLLCLMRENLRSEPAHFITSDDEGKTWSVVKSLPPGLHGDRYKAVFAPDGRLILAFRDMGHDSPTRMHFVAWVGSYQDIINGKDGAYKIKLLHSHSGSDCGYPGLEVLPDGTLVATTYIKYRPGLKKHSVVGARFKLAETDRAEKIAISAPVPRFKAAGIVIDDTQAMITGNWQETESSEALLGKSFATADDKSASAAIFRPDIPEAGAYEARLLYIAAPNRGTNLTVTLRTAEGEKTVTLNQRLPCLEDGIPRALGVFRFAAGRTTITVSNKNADGYLSVDGLQFVPEKIVKAERAAQSGTGSSIKAATRKAATYEIVKGEIQLFSYRRNDDAAE